MESVANGLGCFFVVFRENTPSRTEVDCDTVQRTGVLLSSTTSDQIRRIPKRLMLEVRVATKSLYTYIRIYVYKKNAYANIPEFDHISQTSKFLNQNNFGMIPDPQSPNLFLCFAVSRVCVTSVQPV